MARRIWTRGGGRRSTGRPERKHMGQSQVDMLEPPGGGARAAVHKQKSENYSDDRRLYRFVL
jgi:hypothetical protein